MLHYIQVYNRVIQQLYTLCYANYKCNYHLSPYSTITWLCFLNYIPCCNFHPHDLFIA